MLVDTLEVLGTVADVARGVCDGLASFGELLPGRSPPWVGDGALAVGECSGDIFPIETEASAAVDSSGFAVGEAVISAPDVGVDPSDARVCTSRLDSAAWHRVYSRFDTFRNCALKGRLLERLRVAGGEQIPEGTARAPATEICPYTWDVGIVGPTSWADASDDEVKLQVSDVGVTRADGHELAALEREQRAVRKALKFLKGTSSDLSKVHERAYEVRKRIRELRGDEDK